MKIIGFVHCLTDIIEGQSENGFWKKQTLVIKNGDQFIAVEFFGSQQEKLKNMAPRDFVEVQCNIESHEGAPGKWYTKLSGYAVQVYGHKLY